MSQHGPEGDQKRILQRLRAMGLEARLMKGGRCVLATLRLQGVPFESPGGRVSISKLLFSTVGTDRIKCLRPRVLFSLPMVRIADCRDPSSIEARVRLAWRQRMQQLEDARRWLAGLGVSTRFAEEDACLQFELAGEGPPLAVSVIESGRVILPSVGPLSEQPLDRAEDRELVIGAEVTSAAELELQVTNRLAELSRLAERIGRERRIHQMRAGHKLTVHVTAPTRAPQILLVGPRMLEATLVQQRLRVRGYTLHLARGEQEALAVFDRFSPEMVLSDYELGRSDGAALIMALRRIRGVEELPVLLVDDEKRPGRREAARQVGAAAYITHPIDVQAIADRLSNLIEKPRRRRFTRYARRLPVEIEGTEQPCIATMVGRGGMFLSTQDDLPSNTLQRCWLALPELGARVGMDAEVLYRMGGMPNQRQGVGLRFARFDDDGEAVLIDYLRQIDHRQPLL